MSATIVVPRLAESISDAVLVEWLKADGEAVKVDEPVATLETDKAAVEIAASADGVLKHQRKVGDQVHVGDVLAEVVEGNGAKGAAPKASAAPAKPAPAPAKPAEAPKAAAPPAPAAPAAPPAAKAPADRPLSPAVRRMVEEGQLDPAAIAATGPGGRILKEDVQRHLEGAGEKAAAPPPLPSSSPSLAGAMPEASLAGERVV